MTMENNNYMTVINASEYQQRILDCITSNELDKYFNCTVFSDKPECRQAMIHGMCIASMLISDCSTIIMMEKPIEKDE